MIVPFMYLSPAHCIDKIQNKTPLKKFKGTTQKEKVAPTSIFLVHWVYVRIWQNEYNTRQICKNLTNQENVLVHTSNLSHVWHNDYPQASLMSLRQSLLENQCK